MTLFSLSKRSIFFRIYSGLLIVCVAAAFFAYLLVNTINQERAQTYRETLASGVFYLLGEGAQHADNPADLDYWLNDTSARFGSEFKIVDTDSVAFKVREQRRLNNGDTVVRHQPHSGESVYYQGLGDGSRLLTVTLSQVGERQVRALTYILLDDLSYYPTYQEKQVRLGDLSKKFSYPVRMYNIDKIALDTEQVSRLRRDEMVMLFEDGNYGNDSYLSFVVASDVEDRVIVVGPIPLFNWFPINLLASVVVICMLLIALGIYALIFPLQRRLQLLQAGVDRVSSGDLNTKVQVVGRDDIARLSSTFNAMTGHIKRLIEAQRELSRAVSHELRTPIARIRFAVDMLADDDDYDSRQLQKTYIDEDIESLNKLVDEILTYAKLEEGSPKLDWEMVGLRSLLFQIEHETNALGKPIKITISPPSDKVLAMADRRYLHRVLQNLVGNALRYADSTVHVSAGVQKGMAFITVEDDGHGIAEADRDKVFIPFARLDDSRTRSTGGYGLGLSIVSRIAFWFNADLSVDESPALHGARFSMRWPVKQVGALVAADDITAEKAEKKLIKNGLS